MTKRLEKFFIDTINNILFDNKDDYAIESVSFQALMDNDIDSYVEKSKKLFNDFAKKDIVETLKTQIFSTSVKLEVRGKLDGQGGISMSELTKISEKFGINSLFITGSGYDIVEDETFIDSVAYIIMKIDFLGNNIKLSQEYDQWLKDYKVKLHKKTNTLK